MENILQFITHDLLSACCTLANHPTVQKAVVQTHCISVPQEKRTYIMKDWDINRVFDNIAALTFSRSRLKELKQGGCSRLVQQVYHLWKT